ncbi:hypothetical protein ACFC8U_16315 [Enterococcus casseliflavus]|uniref:hypothetical protein n=1 Tax=Enterococcus casseliflavus TaxID=37734 RepID=UPI0039A4E13C
MKKTTIIKVITIGTACFLAILAGYTLAKSEHFIQQIAKEITEGASIKGSNKINSNEIEETIKDTTGTKPQRVRVYQCGKVSKIEMSENIE